jgi:hypothetical protein
MKCGMVDQEQSPPPGQAYQCGSYQCHSPHGNKAAFVYDVGGPSRSCCCTSFSSLNVNGKLLNTTLHAEVSWSV